MKDTALIREFIDQCKTDFGDNLVDCEYQHLTRLAHQLAYLMTVPSERLAKGNFSLI